MGVVQQHLHRAVPLYLHRAGGFQLRQQVCAGAGGVLHGEIPHLLSPGDHRLLHRGVVPVGVWGGLDLGQGDLGIGGHPVLGGSGHRLRLLLRGGGGRGLLHPQPCGEEQRPGAFLPGPGLGPPHQAGGHQRRRAQGRGPLQEPAQFSSHGPSFLRRLGEFKKNSQKPPCGRRDTLV